MTFFDPPPPPPELPPQPPRRDWMGPPEGWLGGHVPLRVELGRAEGIVVLLGDMEAFPTGVRFELLIAAREPSFGPGPMGPLGDDARIGVAFADGSKWQGMRPDFDFTKDPPAPHVMFHGGGGGGSHWAHRLWLWPLPPPGPVTFALSAPSIGIPEATAVVEGAVLRAAADEAEHLWDPLPPEELAARHRAHMGRVGGFSTTAVAFAGKPDDEDDPEEP